MGALPIAAGELQPGRWQGAHRAWIERWGWQREATPRSSGWSLLRQQWEGTPTWRVMMSCREKGSSVSRSRKFLALIFSCSTA